MIADVAALESYYRAALRGLRFVEARRPSGRRFGADADARWAAFRGGLQQIDRIELLLRDADAEWPGSFGAHGVFALGCSANDEPFGPEWPSLASRKAASIWNEEMKAELSADDRKLPHALNHMADAWGLKLGRTPVPHVGANDRLLVVGPSAVLSAARAFEQSQSLSICEQVTVVATSPAHRQLAFFLTALLDQRAPMRVLAADELASFKPPRGTRSLESKDAADEDRNAAHSKVRPAA
jgi:hypothetical protein